MLAACARKNAGQLCSSRLGAGWIPAPFRIDQTVLAASLIPSPTSSPWMRRYPQPGFSRANCSTSSRSSAAVGGRPGRRGRYVQRRATSSRCQRRSVAGVTNSDRFHAPRGREHGRTLPAAPDQPASAADGRPGAQARAADAAAAGSRSPSPAPSGTAARPAQADAAATSTQTTGPRPQNDPPPPLTLAISRPRPETAEIRVSGTHTVTTYSRSASRPRRKARRR